MATTRTTGLLIAATTVLSGCSAVVDAVDAVGAEGAADSPAVIVVDSRSTATSTTAAAAAPAITSGILDDDATGGDETGGDETGGGPVGADDGIGGDDEGTINGAGPAATGVDDELAVYDADCVVVVRFGDSLDTISRRFDDATVDPAALTRENGLDGDIIDAGALLDVCVDNGLDDITGAQRVESDAESVAIDARKAVEAQQRHLNTLFAGYGIDDLVVDGISGPVTRQRLCAFRVARGLPVSLADMAPGSEEEQRLLSTETLPIPFTSAILSERWIVIDQRCQIMFVGSGSDRLEFVFATSTGSRGFETRPQNRTRLYRFNPANQNGGWHNSTTYPAAHDNPLNGNMYRPLYFDRGQAIHGANNVPRSPASHGCARLRVHDQDALIAWLGLTDSGPTSDPGRINATINVQGTWQG